MPHPIIRDALKTKRLWKKEIKKGKSSGQSGWTTKLEVPIDPLSNGLLIKKRVPEAGDGRCLDIDFLEVEGSWRKMEYAEEAVIGVVLLPVQMR